MVSRKKLGNTINEGWKKWIIPTHSYNNITGAPDGYPVSNVYLASHRSVSCASHACGHWEHLRFITSYWVTMKYREIQSENLLVTDFFCITEYVLQFWVKQCYAHAEV